MVTSTKTEDKAMKKASDSRTLDEVLFVLEEYAEDKKDELKELIGRKYHRLRDIFQEEPKRLVALSEEKVEEVVEKGRAAAKKTINQVNKQMHDNPMPFVVSALLLGFILANRKGNGKV